MSLENAPPIVGDALKWGDENCSEEVKNALAEVEKATADVHEAASGLGRAENKLKQAEADLKEALEHPKRFEVEVVYNGVKHRVAAEAAEPEKALLERAIKSFGSLPNAHTLALFTKEGRELPENGTVKEAGIRPCESLLLRPSTVRGG
jgi:hypothetical protein